MEEKFTFFWSGPFSQWHKSNFTVDGVLYNCAEQYMMASKARLFNDEQTLALIMKEKSPKEQKRLGRIVKGFNKEEWEVVARNFVYRGNVAKFSQNPSLLAELYNTQGTTLVEASPYDSVWGIALSEEDPRCKDRKTWLGKNWLGETITKVRNDLLKKEIK